MNGFFRIDGPFYKFGNILYYLIVGNLLWFVFSLPIFTIGASTTALFYVMGKVIRDEDITITKDFWKSFKMNFKQGTIIWLILAFVISIVVTNIMNMKYMGNMASFLGPAQLVLLIEFIIITIYAFPILSRYEMSTKNVLRTAFFLGNRHILTTIFCIAIIAGVFLLLYKFPGVFILMPVSLSVLGCYYFIHHVFQKYHPDEKDEVINDDDTFSISETDDELSNLQDESTEDKKDVQ